MRYFNAAIIALFFVSFLPAIFKKFKQISSIVTKKVNDRAIII